MGYRQLARITKQRTPVALGMWKNCISPTSVHGPHYKPGIHLYVSREAIAARRGGLARYPVGSIFVKEKFDQPEDVVPSLITVMEKLRGTGQVTDWKYTMIDLATRKVVSDGFPISCIQCHGQHTATDFVTPETTAMLTAYLK